jgi:hypothetical protein
MKHRLAEEAMAYLRNVDRISKLRKKQKGAEYISDLRWEADTKEVLRAAFNKERYPGELFGDFVTRISGTNIKAKSLYYNVDFPGLNKIK